MIAEKFDESMLLLQSQLCWKVTDMTYLKLNERQGNIKLPGITLVDAELKIIF